MVPTQVQPSGSPDLLSEEVRSRCFQPGCDEACHERGLLGRVSVPYPEIDERPGKPAIT